MNRFAHRGFADDAAENTLPALRRAADIADGVEFDVRRCGSGDLVVHHDETVNRVTDGEGPVASFSAAELADLDVLDSGHGVPTLAAVFDALPPTTVNVELKERGLAADAAALWDDYAGDVFVSAFDATVLTEARTAAPDTPTAYLDWDPDVERAAELDCAYVHPGAEAVDAAFVRKAHDAGLRVNAWTVETAAEAERLRRAGVDGIIADTADV